MPTLTKTEGPWLMDINAWTSAGVIITAIGVLVAAYFGVRMLRKQFPKRELRYIVRVIPLLSDRAVTRHDDIRVLLRGKALSQPYAVTVYFESHSRADIPSASFDAGRSIAVTSTTPMYVSGVSSTGTEAIGFMPHSSGNHEEGTRVLAIPPQLIRPKSYGFINAITDGKPQITVDSSLVDIVVKDATSATDKPRVWLVVALWLAVAALGAGIMILLGQALSSG